MTLDSTLFCIEFVDKGFVMAVDFPKASYFVYFDNLTFISSTKIDHRDLSITNFEIPTTG